MSKSLPELIDPIKLADKNARIKGEIPLSRLVRLKPLLYAEQGNVSFEMEFGIDVEGKHYVQGIVQSILILECQRCLESMHYEINNTFKLAMVHSDNDSIDLPDQYDPLLVETEGLIKTIDIIEDELILSLPPISLHQDDCGYKISASPIKESSKPNPFNILSELQKK